MASAGQASHAGKQLKRQVLGLSQSLHGQSAAGVYHPNSPYRWLVPPICKEVVHLQAEGRDHGLRSAARVTVQQETIAFFGNREAGRAILMSGTAGQVAGAAAPQPFEMRPRQELLNGHDVCGPAGAPSSMASSRAVGTRIR